MLSVLPKYKKGPAEGITALVLLGICIIVAQFIFFAAIEYGFIEVDSWFRRSIFSSIASFIGLIIFYIIARNLINQGKSKAYKQQSFYGGR